MKLVYYTNGQNEVPYTLSTIIAECAEVEHATVQRLVRRHKESLEKLGKLGFEIRPLPSGQKIKDYKLNEQQATLLITFMRNTDKVIEFKENLVKAFYQQRELINDLKIARMVEKPKRKELTDAIKDWKHANKWSYKTITDLLLKLTTGMNAKQLKEHHNSKLTSLDLLSLEEHEIYYNLENQAIVLIQLGFTYERIKQTLMEGVRE